MGGLRQKGSKCRSKYASTYETDAMGIKTKKERNQGKEGSNPQQLLAVHEGRLARQRKERGDWKTHHP